MEHPKASSLVQESIFVWKANRDSDCAKLLDDYESIKPLLRLPQLTFVASVMDASMDLQSEFHDELEDDKENENPERVIETTQLHSSRWHSKTQHNGGDGEYMGGRANYEVGPIEVGSILVHWVWSTKGDEGLDRKQKSILMFHSFRFEISYGILKQFIFECMFSSPWIWTTFF